MRGRKAVPHSSRLIPAALVGTMVGRSINRPRNTDKIGTFWPSLADRAGRRGDNDFKPLQKQTTTYAAVEVQRFSGPLANRVRELSRDVRRIGHGARCDPESIAIDKESISIELNRLAGRLEGWR